jgi:riboflavin kinase/FMN adenylyltransferase
MLWGVYAVVVHGLGELPHSSVANIGNRPTISGRDDHLEVPLFDFNGQWFESFNALKQQNKT